MIGKLGMFDRAKRLRVLHVIPSVAPCRGGPSKAVVEMVSHLRSIGLDAEIATTNDDGPNELNICLNTLIDYKGVPTRFFKRFSPSINAVREFAYSGQFRRWLSDHINEYDVIHVHAIFSYCSSYAMYLARKRNIPYVVRPLGLLQRWSLQQSYSRKKLYLNLLERASLESAPAVQFTAELEMKEANEQLNLNGHVIPLGIEQAEKATLNRADLESLLAINTSGFTILYLSRLHQKKGLELLMKALAQIGTMEFKLLIAGDGDDDYKLSLVYLSEQLNIDSKCYFLGQVEGDAKAALLANSDLYVLTSYSENFGISVLEAMASGLTPLVSNHVALSKIIEDNGLGLTCSLEINDIARQLRYALNNPELTKSMGRKAQLFTAIHYSWPAIAGKLHRLYTDVSRQRQ